MKGRNPTPCTAPCTRRRCRSGMYSIKATLTLNDDLDQFQVMRLGNYPDAATFRTDEHVSNQILAVDLAVMTTITGHMQDCHINHQLSAFKWGIDAQHLERLPQHFLRESTAASEGY